MAEQQAATPAAEAAAQTISSTHAAAGSKIAPGPRGHWLVGNAAALQRDPLDFPLEMARRYGPVVRVHMFHIPTYLVFHPEGIRRIVQNQQNYDRNLFLYRVMRRFFGDGLATSSGPIHLHHRRLMQSVFHRSSLAAFSTQMTDAIREMLARWQAATEQGQPLEVHGEMTRLILRILGQCLFQMNLTASSNAIGQAVTTLLADLAEYVFVPFPPLSVPTPRNRRMQANLRMLNAVVQRLIEDRRRQSLTEQHDLLSMLLAAQDESGHGLSDQQVREEVLTLIFGGSEAPAHTITWALYLLSLHSEVEQRLYAEVSSVLGGKTPTVEDLKSLHYLRMLILETLRLYPAGGTLPRRAIADDVICGFPIQASNLVFTNAFVTHRLPEFWPDPERFDPERFTPERVAARHPYAHIPFGGGEHFCIGNPLFMMEAQLILSMVVQRYWLSLVPGQRVEPKATIIVRPSSGVHLMLHPREQLSGAAAR